MADASNPYCQDYFRENLFTVTDECKVWPFAQSKGYGRMHLGGRQRQVHIVACEAWHGPRPEGTYAAHGPCHNPLCWNGAHLSWKTPEENQADRLRDGTSARGEGNPAARLTTDAVLAIRARRAAGEPRRAVAAAYGVSPSLVTLIVNRRRWAHV